VTGLARACLSADGGQPFAADPGFLRQCYLSGGRALAGWDRTRLVCASSLRWLSAGQPATGGPEGAAARTAVTTGLLHPAWRRRGIGGHAFDWAADGAGSGALRAETEAVSDGAHALYLGRGMSRLLAEDVLQLAALSQTPAGPPPGGLTLAEWGQASRERFYAVYTAAFRDRPGFPGRSLDQWVEWISDDEDFRPQWSLLASTGGTDVGFIAGAATGWITQVGVVPSARGQGIGAWLVAEAVRRMRAAGETAVTLNVNVNNPGAAALYRRLGFTRVGGRARYQRDGPVPAEPATAASGTPGS
jgi:mycothiol synthase